MHPDCSPLAPRLQPPRTSGGLQYFLEPFGRNAPPPPAKSVAKLLLTECKVHSPARSSRLGRYAELSFELEVQTKPSRSFVFSAQTHAELQRWLAAFRESQTPQRSRSAQREEGSLGSADLDLASLSSASAAGAQEPRTPSAAEDHVAALMGRQPATHLEHMESAVCQDRWING